ncbi:MAG: formylglycine-generating enzyme family protein [Bacteroidales bacterium]|jgi:formylglycine-generating enzyme required for sulfatase activity|nr:formylglycine-generating enzyme family protein [Bacteroidales bacterium]
MKTRTFILLFLLFPAVSLFGSTRYFVGFSSIAGVPASAAGSTNIAVTPQSTLGATLLTVLGSNHTYNPANGDTVFLAVGKYMLTSEITIPDGVTVLGGYAANASNSLTRTYPASLWPTNILTNMTVLDGNSFLSLPADKHRVATVRGTLETCYIRNGYSKTNGGGLYVDGGKVTACIIRGNVAMNKSYTSNGGGAYITNGGEMYYCLVTNNMANYGFGIYVDSGSLASNVTMIYNTWSPRPVLIKGTGGNNGTSTTIGDTVTDVTTYFSHEQHIYGANATAKKDANLRIQLSDFYIQQTETTVVQYCCFLAAIDYIVVDNKIRIPFAIATTFVALPAFITNKGTMSIDRYYNFTDGTISNAPLCHNSVAEELNYSGYGVQNKNNVMYPQEKLGNGSIPFDEISLGGVSWYGAIAYSHWLGGSLPTEAQFEFAMRRTTDTFSGNNASGVSTGAYPYGTGMPDDATNYGWYNANLGGVNDADSATPTDYGITSAHARRVGQKSPSPLGLYDMIGNMFEWCADYYNGDTYLYNNVADRYLYSASSGTETNSVYLNPIYRTSIAISRIVRGGSWHYEINRMRSGYRYVVVPSNNSYMVGFRPAWNLPAL